jgi:hypothetical protein
MDLSQNEAFVQERINEAEVCDVPAPILVRSARGLHPTDAFQGTWCRKLPDGRLLAYWKVPSGDSWDWVSFIYPK